MKLCRINVLLKSTRNIQTFSYFIDYRVYKRVFMKYELHKSLKTNVVKRTNRRIEEQSKDHSQE